MEISKQNNENNNENNLYIPPHISKYCVYSSNIILICSTVAFLCNYKIVSLLLLCLYITSNLYWRNPVFNGTIKKIDIFFVFLTFGYLIYRSFGFKEKYRKIWITTVLIVLVIAIINEALYCFKIVGVFKDDNIEGLDNKREFGYFTLDYTYPNTPEREKACYFSVIVHCLFTHILPSITGMYCIMMNPV